MRLNTTPLTQKTRTPMNVILGLVLAAFLISLTPATALAKKPNASQQRMKDCNAKAKTDGLKGKDRKTFMKGCLKNPNKKAPVAKKPKAPKAPKAGKKKAGATKAGAKTGPKKPNPAHERMRTCSATAKKDGLKGAARKAFMKTCLKKK